MQRPSPIKLSRNAEGELSATAPFTLRAAPGFPTAEVAIEPQAGTLRITCSWDTSARLQVSVTAAAGHGLPGRINLRSQIGESPHTLEVQVATEQAARGPVYVEVAHDPFQRGTKGVVHGTITAVLAGIGAEEPSDIDRLRSAIADGKLLSGSEVDALEAKLKNSPGDWPTRIELTSYYSSSATLRMSKSQIIAARRRHILWAIENRAAEPEIFSMPAFQISTRGPLADSEGVKEAEQAWRRAVTNSAQNSDVLLNAALFSVIQIRYSPNGSS